MKKLLTKRMINLHNSSDEYHTANDDSFTSASIGSQQTAAASGGGGGGGGAGTVQPTTLAARKQMPNEPSKPLSAYAYFFRDTVSAIKQQNPSCSFQELSKIVASMWEALDPAHKAGYNKKNEVAKNDYIKQMRIYRQQQQQQQQQQSTTDEGLGQTNAAATIPQQISLANNNKPASLFSMDINQQQKQTSPNAAALAPSNNTIQPQMVNMGNNNNTTIPAINNSLNNSNTTAATSMGDAEPVLVVNDNETVQKCTRENCNKRAIINPDWEDEYCSNECVVIHCRNVFNAWVQSNLEAKQQQLTPDLHKQQQGTAT
ncbi:TOX high mobility group box family member 4 isoform X2 [Stomoxys calcitrans]|uniref:TOX high mobility group box family member 4 isoform X2 n=1 Tax=Stomoxys calcitrans TaxID=35570 RepID=UPI0027E30CAA|nr:TOX high mobility group box family member 4 isoform X2 [Stomoxys calcitrans]